MTASIAQRSISPVSFRLHQQDPEAFAQALGASFARYGFAVIADHGLHQAHIDAAIADAKAFFALPDSVKRRYRRRWTRWTMSSWLKRGI